jgi:hypothetical protein
VPSRDKSHLGKQIGSTRMGPFVFPQSSKSFKFAILFMMDVATHLCREVAINAAGFYFLRQAQDAFLPLAWSTGGPFWPRAIFNVAWGKAALRRRPRNEANRPPFWPTAIFNPGAMVDRSLEHGRWPNTPIPGNLSTLRYLSFGRQRRDKNALQKCLVNIKF